jgi:hypothetical protein
MPTEEQIKDLAYKLWEEGGRQEGKDWEYYFTARRMLEEQEAASQNPPPADAGKPAAPPPARPGKGRPFPRRR